VLLLLDYDWCGVGTGAGPIATGSTGFGALCAAAGEGGVA